MENDFHVCLLNDSFPPVIDGVANAVYNYAEILTRKYGESIVATPYYPNVTDNYAFPVIRYPSIDTTRLVGYRAGQPFSPAVLRDLEKRNIDIIHTHCPVMSTFLARMLRERINKPIVLTYHTKFDIDISRAISAKSIQTTAIRLLVDNISACDEVWVVSRGAGENLRSLGYEGEYVVMENGVDMPKGPTDDAAVARLSAQYALPTGMPVFLFVGRIMWYKGFRLILDALAAYKAKGRPFKFFAIGDGADSEEIIRYANQLGLGDSCVFLGRVLDRELLRAWYSRADMLLFPSTFDTFGLVVREAAACGLPSLLLKNSSAAEGVIHGKNGILVEEDPLDMAAALERYCSDPAALKQMGKAAMDSLYISWEQSVAKAYERYQVVLENWKSGKLVRKRARFDGLFSISGGILDGLDKARIHIRGGRVHRK